jgi:hypothetical protein
MYDVSRLLDIVKIYIVEGYCPSSDMSKSRGYIGSRVTGAMVAFSVSIIVFVLFAILMSQPLLPEVQMDATPPGMHQAMSGYVGELNYTAKNLTDATSIFGMNGTMDDNGYRAVLTDSSKFLVIAKRGGVQFDDSGHQCSGSIARNRSEFPDPLPIAKRLIAQVVQAGLAPDYPIGVIRAHDTVEQGTGLTCFAGLDLAMYHDGLALNANLSMSITHEGQLVRFESGAFFMKDDRPVKLAGSDGSVRRVARAEAHTSWPTARYVAKVIVENVSLQYSFPSSGYRVFIGYHVSYRCIYNDGGVAEREGFFDAGGG